MGTEHAFLQTIIDNLQEGVIVANQDGNFIAFNRVAEQILGLGSVNILPTQWTSIYGCYKSDKETPYQVDELPLVRALQGVTVPDEVMFIQNAARTKGVWINIAGHPIKDDQDRVTAGVVIFRDITHRMTGIDKLSTRGVNIFSPMETDLDLEWKTSLTKFSEFEAQYNLLSSAVQETDDSIVITDAKGSIIYVNSGFERKTGYSREDALGQTPRMLKSGHHDEAFYQALWGQISSGQHFRGSIRNKKKNGDLYWSEQTITPIKNESGEITNYVSVLKDITDLIEKQRLQREIELAAEIQFNVIPEILPTLPGFDIGARIKPARGVSGDFYDIIPINERKVGVLIGDVIDKGMPAAILMARVHALIVSGAGRHDNPSEVLREVNTHLSKFKRTLQFVTVLFGLLDCETGEFAYARAGHEPPFILLPDGSVQWASYQLGMVLGLFDDIVLDEQTIHISPGTTLLLFTDGVIDCQNKDGISFGLGGIQDALKDMAGKTAQSVCDLMLKLLEEFQQSQEQFDDIALVALKATA